VGDITGIEGWVHLRFTVTEQGATTDIQIVDADPKGYFEQSARKAVEKYKYKPRIENGTAMARRGSRSCSPTSCANDAGWEEASMIRQMFRPMRALAALLLALGVADSALAEARAMPGASTKVVQPVRRWAYRFLERAFAALDQEKNDEALAALDEMRQKDRRLNLHERALMHQT
jgi:TonB family protein